MVASVGTRGSGSIVIQLVVAVVPFTLARARAARRSTSPYFAEAQAPPSASLPLRPWRPAGPDGFAFGRAGSRGFEFFTHRFADFLLGLLEQPGERPDLELDPEALRIAFE